LRDRCPQASVELSGVIEQALARDPAHRFADAQRFGEALQSASLYPPRPSLLLGRKLDPAGREAPVGGPGHPRAANTLGARAPVMTTAPAHGRVTSPLGTASAPRRRFARAVYVTYVSIILHDGTSLDARSEDISVGGMLILPKSACQEEEIAAVSFALPMTGRIIELKAVARWVKTARIKQAMGIQFGALPADVLASIERYVQVMGSDES
jgi:hypothetical protein